MVFCSGTFINRSSKQQKWQHKNGGTVSDCLGGLTPHLDRGSLKTSICASVKPT
ncbi:hypothetical protein GCWU000324_02936 [Kingella oralis ATCC 51147]|uniref:Uncharacterized protein n=1 Tax=Kingella oralis ATCC 51147 TaxID=629741 RepID=C4GMK2_9NEIS|nr:hypothetical protein GCWU000324_02936 [Kingella oralis ATCC 51147]